MTIDVNIHRPTMARAMASGTNTFWVQIEDKNGSNVALFVPSFGAAQDIADTINAAFPAKSEVAA